MSDGASLTVDERSSRFERSFFVFVWNRSGVSGSASMSAGVGVWVGGSSGSPAGVVRTSLTALRRRALVLSFLGCSGGGGSGSGGSGGGVTGAGGGLSGAGGGGGCVSGGSGDGCGEGSRGASP